jgi:hypothetical protein
LAVRVTDWLLSMVTGDGEMAPAERTLFTVREDPDVGEAAEFELASVTLAQ